jgi:uncharacterized membrane protein
LKKVKVIKTVISVIMLFFGVKFRKHGSENINKIYGYRTSMSKKNKETWEFAHKYCAKSWMKLGFVMLIISIIGREITFTLIGDIQGIIEILIVTIQTAVLIISIFHVEKALKNNFIYMTTKKYYNIVSVPYTGGRP